MRYVAGLDGGGTKTAVTIADEFGGVVHTFTSGGINYNGQDEASIGRNLTGIFEGIAKACGGLENCAAICIGAAGISNPEVISRLQRNVKECGYDGKLIITGDHETALCGAQDSLYGMILIAGTGSICFGKNESELTHRTGGFGYLIDDEGSGYSIGRDLLTAVVKEHDGRSPKTAITDMVYEQLRLKTVREIVGFVYDKNMHKKDIAALAPILSAACALNDETALGIAQKSAESLLELVIPVVEKLSLQSGVLAMSGSVLLKSDVVRTAFMRLANQHYPDLQCITAKRDAASGATLMAISLLK